MATPSNVVASAAVTASAHASAHHHPLSLMSEFWKNIKDYAPNLIRWTLILSTTAFFGPKLFALAATKSYLFAGLGNWIAAHTPAFLYTIGAKLSFLTPAVNAIGAGAAWLLNALANGLETFSTLVMVAGQSALGAGKFGAFTVAAAGLAVINTAVDVVLTLGAAAVDTITRRNTTSNIRPAHDVADATFGRVDRLATRAYNWTKAKLAPIDVVKAEVRDEHGNVIASAEAKTPAADRTRTSSVASISDSPLPARAPATLSPAKPGNAGVDGTHRRHDDDAPIDGSAQRDRSRSASRR